MTVSELSIPAAACMALDGPSTTMSVLVSPPTRGHTDCQESLRVMPPNQPS
jgi:hypothetical protein